jgi:hypothetical protein
MARARPASDVIEIVAISLTQGMNTSSPLRLSLNVFREDERDPL